MITMILIDIIGFTLAVFEIGLLVGLTLGKRKAFRDVERYIDNKNIWLVPSEDYTESED